MMQALPFLLLFGTSCWISYIREIDRLERDEEPRQDGKRFLITAMAALVLCVLFTLWSVDAGLIMLTLTLYLSTLLLGIAGGHRIAWMVYCRRNPELFAEE